MAEKKTGNKIIAQNKKAWHEYFVDEKYDEIVEFSGLEKFIDVPLKNYSSGMKARLGFSIATVVEPEIMILDEVLSVGDARFKKKSEAKILNMFENHVTVLFVSHSIGQVRSMCNKVLWLHRGEQVEFGSDVQGICDRYQKFLEGTEKGN